MLTRDHCYPSDDSSLASHNYIRFHFMDGGRLKIMNRVLQEFEPGALFIISWQRNLIVHVIITQISLRILDLSRPASGLLGP